MNFDANIYLLEDPRTDEVRYVGATTLKPPERLSSHRCNNHAPTALRVWRDELRAAGLVITMRVIGTVPAEFSAPIEQVLIDFYPKQQLLNSVPAYIWRDASCHLDKYSFSHRKNYFYDFMELVKQEPWIRFNRPGNWRVEAEKQLIRQTTKPAPKPRKGRK